LPELECNGADRPKTGASLEYKQRVGIAADAGKGGYHRQKPTRQPQQVQVVVVLAQRHTSRGKSPQGPSSVTG